MSLVGTYTCKPIGAILTVTSANDSNGQGAGTFTIGGQTINVSIHYHFVNSVGPVTNLAIWGFEGDPNFFIGGAGATDASNYKTIELSGGYAMGVNVSPFSGAFVRV